MDDKKFEEMEQEHIDEMRDSGYSAHIFRKLAEPLLERSRFVNRLRPELCFYIYAETHMLATDGKIMAAIELEKIP